MFHSVGNITCLRFKNVSAGAFAVKAEDLHAGAFRLFQRSHLILEMECEIKCSKLQ